MDTPKPVLPPLRLGFITEDDKRVCLKCLPNQDDAYRLPWLYSGERYTCHKCEVTYEVPE